MWQKNLQSGGQAPPPDFCTAWTGTRCKLNASVMYSPCLWRDYRSALDEYERALRGLSYSELPLPSAPFSPYGLPS